jgi:hypothetical protein
MKRRCSNPHDANFANYGGRGITVCQEWRQFEPFQQWALTNGYQEGLTIDRIDNDGNYEPGNCRWVTMSDQTRNSRRNITLSIDGEAVKLIEWADAHGIPPRILHNRLRRGWTPERTLSQPVRGR